MKLASILSAAVATCVAFSAIPASAKTAKECNAEYVANKGAIQGGGQKKKDFVTACRAGTEVVPGGAAMAPAPAPAPTSTAAPTPAPAPAPAPTTTAARPAPRAPAAPTEANQFATEAEAHGRCGAALVVWVNTKSKIYHFSGSKDYGTTKHGAYMCEADATAGGDRAAKNEKHP